MYAEIENSQGNKLFSLKNHIHKSIVSDQTRDLGRCNK